MDSLTIPNPLPARHLAQGRAKPNQPSQVRARQEESPNLVSGLGGTTEELTEGIENISDPDPDNHIDQFQDTLVLDKQRTSSNLKQVAINERDDNEQKMTPRASLVSRQQQLREGFEMSRM